MSGGYFRVPDAWVDDGLIASLGFAATKVLVVFCRHVNDDRECHPSIARISRLAGVSRSCAFEAIRQLESAGLVIRATRSGSSNKYHLASGPESGRVGVQNLDGRGPEISTGGVRKSGPRRKPNEGNTMKETSQHQVDADAPSRTDVSNSNSGGGSFADFWRVVHNRVGKRDAQKAFDKAVTCVAKERSISRPEATAYIIDRMIAFSRTPAAHPADHTPIHPATWLNKGRYDDDPDTWDPSSKRDPHKLAIARLMRQVEDHNPEYAVR